MPLPAVCGDENCHLFHFETGRFRLKHPVGERRFLAALGRDLCAVNPQASFDGSQRDEREMGCKMSLRRLRLRVRVCLCLGNYFFPDGHRWWIISWEWPRQRALDAKLCSSREQTLKRVY